MVDKYILRTVADEAINMVTTHFRDNNTDSMYYENGVQKTVGTIDRELRASFNHQLGIVMDHVRNHPDEIIGLLGDVDRLRSHGGDPFRRKVHEIRGGSLPTDVAIMEPQLASALQDVACIMQQMLQETSRTKIKETHL